MSRTRRKHSITFNKYYHDKLRWYHTPYLWWKEYPSREDTRREYEEEIRGKNWIDFTVPRSHRNVVNRKRRRWDKQELWKEIYQEDYENMCSLWNCKSSMHWDFW